MDSYSAVLQKETAFESVNSEHKSKSDRNTSNTISTETNPTKSPRTARANVTDKSNKSTVTDKSKHESQQNRPTTTITAPVVNSNGHNPSNLTG